MTSLDYALFQQSLTVQFLFNSISAYAPQKQDYRLIEFVQNEIDG